mmetsp:Transcript_28878/g.94401  ORF Transcript_28878/g.94401 Transcript_28878/m.94401 type:complete len:366 (+) Transcript_28878:970-2067(+)
MYFSLRFISFVPFVLVFVRGVEERDTLPPTRVSADARRLGELEEARVHVLSLVRVPVRGGAEALAQASETAHELVGGVVAVRLEHLARLDPRVVKALAMHHARREPERPQPVRNLPLHPHRLRPVLPERQRETRLGAAVARHAEALRTDVGGDGEHKGDEAEARVRRADVVARQTPPVVERLAVSRQAVFERVRAYVTGTAAHQSESLFHLKELDDVLNPLTVNPWDGIVAMEANNVSHGVPHPLPVRPHATHSAQLDDLILRMPYTHLRHDRAVRRSIDEKEALPIARSVARCSVTPKPVPHATQIVHVLVAIHDVCYCEWFGLRERPRAALQTLLGRDRLLLASAHHRRRRRPPRRPIPVQGR